MELSPLAETLLHRMQEQPETLRYDVSVLGSMFRRRDLERLDQAYKELEQAGLIEPTRASISFFGDPKPIYRLSQAGQAPVGAGL